MWRRAAALASVVLVAGAAAALGVARPWDAEPPVAAGAERTGTGTSTGTEPEPDVSEPPGRSRRAPHERPRRATLSFSGDLLIHSPVYLRAKALGGDRYDFAPLFARIRPWIAGPDLAVCHLEVPITPAPASSYPIFNAPPGLARGIARTGWDACTTASNHTLDQGAAGVGQTIRALRRAGVRHAGSSISARGRRRPTILRANGIRVGLLAYTSDTNGLPVPKPWSVHLIDRRRILTDARRARRAGAEAVVVNLHWASTIAPEYVSAPNRAQLRLVRRLLRSPAITAVVGQGPHVVQPVRRMRGKYAVLGEGNLISSQSAAAGLAAASQDGYVAQLRLVVDADGDRVARVRYLPVWVDHADFSVLPVGRALRRGWGDDAALRASWARTVSVAGRGRGIAPIPRTLGR